MRPDTAEIESCADAERVLSSHGIAAQLGHSLDGHPEFLRATASAMIDAHERYPVLREGRWPLQQLTATSTLDDYHPMAGMLGEGSLAADAYGPGLHIVLLNDDTPRRAHQLAAGDHAAAQPGMFVPAHRTSYGLVMHELGHATMRAEYGNWESVIAQSAERAGIGFDEIAAVSTYALTAPHEFAAEVFAQRNAPEGWTVFDTAQRGRLERYAAEINSRRGRVL